MRRTTHLPLVAVAVAAMATATLVGCDSETSAGEGAPTGPADPATSTPASGEVDDAVVEQLAESAWLPEHVTVDGTEYPRPPGLTEVHLALPEGEQLDGGEFRCHYGSDVTVSGDTLLVGEVVSSNEGCAEDSAEITFQENFLDVFQGTLTYELDDEDGPGISTEPATLTLTHPDGGTITLTENLPIPLDPTE
ncbi:META domain-containing protein [Allonocardiopsis opalescens]|uniref:Heat shock protein HslJ n=1 Tax=Allonocardiopsis opalescens TaxID=1144618 RepID=A0A2T0Q9U8_9ACTN|nr:META domain-containing protein [Allonocardiopsis opalescens]PRY00623.1 heat shock protein HslJ [Allonocardiopsis opalescens]